MNFSELYKNNISDVEEVLNAIWCSESASESQKQYAEQIRKLIGSELFAPENAVPVVQCMNLYRPVSPGKVEQAKALVGGLWTSKYDPYEHQYQCWKHLLAESVNGKPKSICVTTGTGSGKTECFMMPLVHNLAEINKGRSKEDMMEIQALFLYPLNALMEDQKERLEELLKRVEETTNVHLTYAVYNGDLLEEGPKDSDRPKERARKEKILDHMRGAYWVENPTTHEREKKYKYEHMLYTRKQVRDTPPNILLTNPTMLEYILLRKKDERLIDPLKKSLKWVAIDETHTYTGAGATELAMLLRRVLLAFDVDADCVRWATSSATFGNGSDLEAEKRQLKDFIAGITGNNTSQIEVVGGERLGNNEIVDNEYGDGDRWRRILNEDFIELDKLFPESESIEEKLKNFDEMCDRVNGGVMKAKVHFFYRVPNNGLFVRLTEKEEPCALKVFTSEAEVVEDGQQPSLNPKLELTRCKNCGEFLSVALLDTKTDEYTAVQSDDSDMFDIGDNNDDDPKRYTVLGLSSLSSNTLGDGNKRYKATDDGKLVTLVAGESTPDGWYLLGNQKRCCPCCGKKLVRKATQDQDSDDNNATGSVDESFLDKFRVSAEFISRVMAPSILDQLEKDPNAEIDEKILHHGQQYISFADSRQMAAVSTLNQNMEQERMWFYATVYHLLSKRKAEADKIRVEIEKLKTKRDNSNDDDEQEELSDEIKKKRKQIKDYITWDDLAEELAKDKYALDFCTQFVKRSSDSEEMDDDEIKQEVLKNYIHSIMVMYLANRPLKDAAPETMGLFHPCYPQLSNIKKLPNEVEAFNALLSKEEGKISIKDWRNLLQTYIDYRIRSDQSFFLMPHNGVMIDIFSTVRFAKEKPHRKPANKPAIDEKQQSTSRIVRYLCALLSRENGLSTSENYKKYFKVIEGVVNALWDQMTSSGSMLLEEGQRIMDPKNPKFEEDDSGLRFNLANMSFKLFDEIYLCDVNKHKGINVECLRPIAYSFKGFSPYLDGNEPVMLIVDENHHQNCNCYPLYKGSGKPVTEEAIREWAQRERSVLWNNNLWGDNGVFANRLFDIHAVPNYFIQAEHTAQVDKIVSRGLQEDFKKHRINILACSTTMEMGVDLGNLEVVMLSSVPPMPSNYKQRAGRSGRNNKVKSACITLCGSDAIGLRTLDKAIETIIKREVSVPRIDWKSEQIVQRHINSYLVRAFGVFGNGGGSINQRVVNYYTTFEVKYDTTTSRFEILDSESRPMCPLNKLGNPAGTMFERFGKMCDVNTISDDIRNDLIKLLRGTCFDGKVEKVIKNAKEDNQLRYDELSLKLEDYAIAYNTKPISDKYRGLLNMKYKEVLTERLLTYWSTNRFTPNANMPVNVLTLDLTPIGKNKFDRSPNSANPSYGLREALAQYTPGNSIVVDGVVYQVSGVQFANMFQGAHAFQPIARNANKTVYEDVNSISDKIPWDVNNQECVELVRPVGFLPDVKDSKSRIADNKVYTHVNAQLIDGDEWTDTAKDQYLFKLRSNKQIGTAKILYYNEGKGYGYCLCTVCGRAAIEDAVAENTFDKMPKDYNPISPKERFDQNGNPKPKFHWALTGKNAGNPCLGANNKEYIKRNMIIGDLLQTDFCEIKIRKPNENWITNRSMDMELLYTLGIVLTQSLAEYLGKERNAVDFTIMPNGHLCIFDTNPGGAGYSNQLTQLDGDDKPVTMIRVLEVAKKMLLQAKAKKSKDMLLDKFTLRYLKYIDIDKALQWISDNNLD